MSRLELVGILVFVVASSYFALWGCFLTFPSCPPPPCEADEACGLGLNCDLGSGECVNADCAAGNGAQATAACQAESVAADRGCAERGDCCVADVDCVAKGSGDRCVIGAGNSTVCIDDRAADDPPCAEVDPTFVEVAIGSTAFVDGGPGEDVVFCASSAAICVEAVNGHGRCVIP